MLEENPKVALKCMSVALHQSKMVGPARHLFVLFGSSIVQLSFDDGGWGAILANLYARKVDILLRDYGGWNSRQALRVLHQVFPKDVTVIFRRRGGDDIVQSHARWATVKSAPDVINMTFTPIVSMLERVSGVKHISCAIDLYLECLELWSDGCS